ncbi:MAG: cytochrome P450 [Chloroflexia bacterium]|nr:cytochrome P450 [Chloroflexia bacterium]
MAVDQTVTGLTRLEDPYPHYAAWRAESPVLWDEPGNGWTVTGYEAVSAMLRDPRFGADREDIFFGHMDGERRNRFDYLARIQRAMMLFADPPLHTRLRGLVNRAFTPRVVAAMRETIQSVVDDLLDAVPPGGQMDVIRDLAYPLPTMVIARLLGVPAEDRDRLKAWSDDFAMFIGGGSRVPGVGERADASVREMASYLGAIVAARRVTPQIDLISTLLLAEERGDVLGDDELYATCILMLIAGHETTTNLIGNGVRALLDHPDERHRLIAGDVPMESAVEELLRFDSPVQVTSRRALADVAWDGQAIRTGQFVDLWLGAANRDPSRFPDPDDLLLGRPDNRHLAFGFGAHFCIGAPLARLEGTMAIGTLLRRFPELAHDEPGVPLVYADTTVFRALRRLPVRT